MQGKLILVGGGARSGKSRFALDYARSLGPRRLFVATAEAGDDEMAMRIGRHRHERGSEFVTVEEPLNLGDRLRGATNVDVVVVDCLTLWLSNLLMRDLSAEQPEQIEKQIADLLLVLANRRQHIVVVSNEVGLGVVPESALGRVFRDVCGRAHQRIAGQADEVYLAAMGLVVRLLPDPVKTFRPGQLP